MHHYNVRENAVHEAINEHNEVSVHHIGGKVNPADLFTKEHKSDEIFRNLRDSSCLVARWGGAGTVVCLVYEDKHSRVTFSPESRQPVSAGCLGHDSRFQSRDSALKSTTLDLTLSLSSS
jgi:hypothetical protein